MKALKPENIEIIKKHVKTRVLVVVKANAYGHGLVECAQVAEESGAEMVGVATVGEASLLRQAGIVVPILRMTAYGQNEIQSFIDDDIHFFAWTKEHVDEANRLAKAKNKKANVHLKVDTGMGRAGVFHHQVEGIAEHILSLEHVELTGVCSHFHTADMPETDSVERQLERFNKAVDILESLSAVPEYVHISNSPALLRFEKARYNMVRTGVITYGQYYEDDTDLLEGMKAIGSWKARLVSVKTLPPNHGISYSVKYRTSKEEKIGIIPVGYADGFRRRPLGVNEVLLHGQRVKVVGSVCMDQCMIVIPDDVDVQEGDEVVLMGGQGDDYIDSLEIANKWGTNNYDVFANISARVPRVYVR
ncbi:MAG: alanine racemase [Pseudomonadota bacterium]